MVYRKNRDGDGDRGRIDITKKGWGDMLLCAPPSPPAPFNYFQVAEVCERRKSEGRKAPLSWHIMRPGIPPKPISGGRKAKSSWLINGTEHASRMFASAAAKNKTQIGRGQEGGEGGY